MDTRLQNLLRENKSDLAFIDTAGRLQNKKNLMEEYKNIYCSEKINPEYPHETVLVLDATTGQNALNQVEEFKKISQSNWFNYHKIRYLSKRRYIISNM